jgi:hypothetical protein
MELDANAPLASTRKTTAIFCIERDSGIEATDQVWQFAPVTPTPKIIPPGVLSFS